MLQASVGHLNMERQRPEAEVHTLQTEVTALTVRVTTAKGLLDTLRSAFQDHSLRMTVRTRTLPEVIDQVNSLVRAMAHSGPLTGPVPEPEVGPPGWLHRRLERIEADIQRLSNAAVGYGPPRTPEPRRAAADAPDDHDAEEPDAAEPSAPVKRRRT